MKKEIELYYSAEYPAAMEAEVRGLLNMHGYPITEDLPRKGIIIGRYPMRVKDRDFAIAHALIIKELLRKAGCNSTVYVRIKD